MKRLFNKTKYVLICMLMLASLTTRAQQQPMYSQYMFNMMNINPAYAGSRGVPTLTTLYRNQWVGIPGAPQTTSVGLDMPLHNNRIGLGVQLYDDRLGIERTSGVNTSYVFRIQTNERGTLSLGIQAGVLNYRANYLDVRTFQPNDPTFNQNISSVLPSAAAGIYYNSDRFYLGVSTPALLKTKVGFGNRADVTSVGKTDLHLYLASGFVMNLGQDLVLKPSMLVKAVSGAPVEFDFNTNLWIQNIFSVGASYRTGDAVVGMAELQLNRQLRLGYAYDKAFTNLGNYNTGTHELMLRIELGPTARTISSPRYF